MTRGWGRARARPWNTDSSEALVRLERGTSTFLKAVSVKLERVGVLTTYSPALYPAGARVWERTGYEPAHRLQIMERPVGPVLPPPNGEVAQAEVPDWDLLHEIDEQAFEGFWRMSRHGLIEAATATRSSGVLTAGSNGAIDGFAIVGSMGIGSYLQRIAVRPSASGAGLGADLVRAALLWARRQGARGMLLNVRPENDRAIRLYERAGFTDTGAQLVVMERHASRRA
jgi:ribosomal-protein-alanine N-acetyltransferase